jgi:hypothetical protein
MNTKELKDSEEKDINKYMEIEEKLKKKIKTKEVHKGIITDIDMNNTEVQFEIQLPHRDEYKYVTYRLNRGDNIEELLESFNCTVDNIGSMLNSRVLVYSRFNSTNWHIVYSKSDIDTYLNESDYYELYVPPLNGGEARIRQQNLKPQLYILLFTILPITLFAGLFAAISISVLTITFYTCLYGMYLKHRFNITTRRLRSKRKRKIK